MGATRTVCTWVGMMIWGLAGPGDKSEPALRQDGPRGVLSRHCKGVGTQVVIDTPSRRLFLCEQDRALETYRVGLGLRGTGKRKKGDKKTPIGKYSLGTPRPSVAGMHTFIRVGYPTKAQRKKGYTGSAIGIHGPRKNGRLGNTLGCISMKTNDEIDEVASWVDEHRVRKVWIR